MLEEDVQPLPHVPDMFNALGLKRWFVVKPWVSFA